MSPKEDMATDIVYRNCGEVWACGSQGMLADRQIDIQTYMHTHHNTPSPAGRRS